MVSLNNEDSIICVYVNFGSPYELVNCVLIQYIFKDGNR